MIMMRGFYSLSLLFVGRWPTVSCLVVCLIGSIALYMTTIKQAGESSDASLSSIVNHLHAVQKRQTEIELKRQTLINNVIRKRFPWLMQRKSLPNFFLHSRNDTNEDGTIYSEGVMVFLHVPRTGGGALQECLRDIGRNRSKIFSTAMTDSLRAAWDDESRLTPAYRNAFDGHVTLHALGLCDEIKRPCSYSALIRHPLERAISSYFHCRESLGDPMCNVVNANEIPLREWVIFQGSVFFRALLFRSTVCQRLLESNATDYRLLTPAVKVPCWFKHKMWLEELDQNERNMLLEYVVNQLDKWFAVLGTTEDIPASSQMLERVYNLPFTRCSKLQINRDKERVREKNRQRINTNAAHPGSFHALAYDDYVELQYDYRVQKALDADYKLYEKVKHIVQLQKQIYSNKIKS